MKDRNGKEIAIGARCQFKVDGRKWPVIGTVRAFGTMGARCDNGDPQNNDLHTNGMTCSAWLDSRSIEVIQ